MRTLVTIFATAAVLLIHQSAFTTPKVKHEQYKELSLEILKSQPEEYRNKKVCYESVYERYMTTFPPYAELNGFKAGKYYWLLIAPKNLPVVAKKTKTMNSLILTLKKRCKVKIYGKIKKFHIKAKNTMLPSYYLELADIVIISEADSNDSSNHNTRRPRRLLPPRFRK